MKGIDFYEGEGYINLHAIKAQGYSFIYVRGTEPNLRHVANPRLWEYIAQARDMGIPYSYFHIWRDGWKGGDLFSMAMEAQPWAEAFRIAIDFEKPVRDWHKTEAEMLTFAELYNSERGQYPAIYTNRNYARTVLARFGPWVENLPLWISAPDAKTTPVVSPWGLPWMWQTRYNLRLRGCAAALDEDILLGNNL